MWYGVLGTKELLQRTYKNLEQKVQLEVIFIHRMTFFASALCSEEFSVPLETFRVLVSA